MKSISLFLFAALFAGAAAGPIGAVRRTDQLEGSPLGYLRKCHGWFD